MSQNLQSFCFTDCLQPYPKTIAPKTLMFTELGGCNNAPYCAPVVYARRAVVCDVSVLKVVGKHGLLYRKG